MKKKLFSVILLAAAVGLVSMSCGGKSTASSNENATEEETAQQEQTAGQEAYVCQPGGPGEALVKFFESVTTGNIDGLVEVIDWKDMDPDVAYSYAQELIDQYMMNVSEKPDEQVVKCEVTAEKVDGDQAVVTHNLTYVEGFVEKDKKRNMHRGADGAWKMDIMF